MAEQPHNRPPQRDVSDLLDRLAALLPEWAAEFGFQQVGIADTELTEHAAHLASWLERGRNGTMSYMARHAGLRADPDALQPGTLRVISVRMDYLTEAQTPLDDSPQAYVSRYALGRDYHKVLRSRLRRFQLRIEAWVDEHDVPYAGARPFTDSAPVLEKALAAKAGLGWIGKNTLLINQRAGSFFFLGEILTSLELPITPEPAPNRCGSCSACMDVCPTGAIVGPYELDARRCVSYLTIENKGAIPTEFRRAIGNRVFGCDDCQTVCPWNRYAALTSETDFQARNDLDSATLLALFEWTEAEFDTRSAGSAIRRTGYEGWQRNLAVALGNAPPDPAIDAALRARRLGATPLLTEHIDWALKERQERAERLAVKAQPVRVGERSIPERRAPRRAQG